MGSFEEEIRIIMTPNVITIGMDDSVESAAKKMRERKIGCVVVVDRHRVKGIITERDIVKEVAAANRLAAELRVDDIMSSPVKTVSPETTVFEAHMLMKQAGIKKLPVVDNSRLVGIVTMKDIALWL